MTMPPSEKRLSPGKCGDNLEVFSGFRPQTGGLTRGRPNVKTLVRGGGVIHFRAATFRLQPSMCLVPLRLLLAILFPMDQSSFIAPLQEFSHGLPVGPG